MAKTRYEEYYKMESGLPFVFHIGLCRTPEVCVKESNWHENPEIQLCCDGQGAVLLDGKEYRFQKGDIVAVNSDEIHYTYTDCQLKYSCLILDTDLLQRLGIPYKVLRLQSLVKDREIVDQIYRLQEIYCDIDNPFRTAELTESVIRIVLMLYKGYSIQAKQKSETKSFSRVKDAVRYLREHYAEKIVLDRLAQRLYYDKYSLSREFKKMTGQTIVTYLNRFRCQMAACCLKEGKGVAQTAYACGFENLSFFSKTFKTYVGCLPSEYKKRLNYK